MFISGIDIKKLDIAVSNLITVIIVGCSYMLDRSLRSYNRTRKVTTFVELLRNVFSYNGEISTQIIEWKLKYLSEKAPHTYAKLLRLFSLIAPKKRSIFDRGKQLSSRAVYSYSMPTIAIRPLMAARATPWSRNGKRNQLQIPATDRDKMIEQLASTILEYVQNNGTKCNKEFVYNRISEAVREIEDKGKAESNKEYKVIVSIDSSAPMYKSRYKIFLQKKGSADKELVKFSLHESIVIYLIHLLYNLKHNINEEGFKINRCRKVFCKVYYMVYGERETSASAKFDKLINSSKDSKNKTSGLRKCRQDIKKSITKLILESISESFIIKGMKGRLKIDPNDIDIPEEILDEFKDDKDK